MAATKPGYARSSSVSKGIADADTDTVYKDAKQGSSILLSMNRLRLAGSYCDITLVVGDTRVSAHKNVLSSYSRYFEGLLNPNMKEGEQEEITIHNLHGPSVEQLVEFAYTSSISINASNIDVLLEAANFLAVDSVCSACCQYMQDHMNAENCIGILSLADLYGFPALKSSAMDFALNHFYEVANADELDSLPVDEFIKLIGNDKLIVQIHPAKVALPRIQEKTVLNAVIHYLKKKDIVEHQNAVDIFEHVRIPLLDPVDLREPDVLEMMSKNEQLKVLISQRQKVVANKTFAENAEVWTRQRLAGLKYLASDLYGCYGYFEEQEEDGYFNDKDIAADSYVKGMKIWIRRWDDRPTIGGMQVFYANGKSSTHGNTSHEENYEFYLSENDHIVNVILRSGWLIDQIGFITDAGEIHGPWGGDGGDERYLTSPPEYRGRYLAHIKGCVVFTQESEAVHELQFVWGYYDYDRE